MATTNPTITLGDRVRVKNTMLFDGRVGEIIPTSGHPDDPWDWYATLEPDGLYGSQRIGVMLDQIELLDSAPVQLTVAYRDLLPGDRFPLLDGEIEPDTVISVTPLNDNSGGVRVAVRVEQGFEAVTHLVGDGTVTITRAVTA